MKRTVMASTLAVLAAPATTLASPAHTQAHTYLRLYRQVGQHFGTRAPGRNIVRWGEHQHRATRREISRSIAVLRRMLAPPPPLPAAVISTTATFAPAPAAAPVSVAAPPSSGLAACIISHESGGNFQATNGQYEGGAQFGPSAWAQAGGTQYSPTPLGATAAQQTATLNHALAMGMASQWTTYDGC